MAVFCDVLVFGVLRSRHNMQPGGALRGALHMPCDEHCGHICPVPCEILFWEKERGREQNDRERGFIPRRMGG